MADTRVSEALRLAADALDDRGEGSSYSCEALAEVSKTLPLAIELEHKVDALRAERDALVETCNRYETARDGLLRCSKGHIHNQPYGRGPCPICERDALKADKDRLDWLEKLLPTLPLYDWDVKTEKYWWMIPAEGTLHNTLREAIDAARWPRRGNERFRID